MDETYNGSSVIYGKKAFDFLICYLAILYYDLDLALNQVVSNGLKVASFWKIFAPTMWMSVRKACENSRATIILGRFVENKEDSNSFFIGHGLNHFHMKHSFLEILIIFWLTLVDSFCLKSDFLLDQKW